MLFFFKQKTAYEIGVRLVGSEMCIRDSTTTSTSIYEHLIIKSSYLIIQSSYLIIQSSYVIIESSYLIIETSYLIIQSSYQICVIIKKLSILNNNIWSQFGIAFWIFMRPRKLLIDD